MEIPSVFNRVTFGLPVETFRVQAHIALEERLPVVSEFVLRLLRICDRVSLSAFRDYFGFSASEALAVVESLSRQGLLEIHDEELQLSRFSIERFDQTGGDFPRFSKVELKSDTVTFDLISLTPLRPIRGEVPSDNVIKLDASEDVLGQSIERARDAYRQRYPEIASLREDLREKSFGVYSVEDIESKRRNYVPIPISFAINLDGQIERKIDEGFERFAPPELLRSINEQVTSFIPKTLTVGAPGLEEFIETFDLKLMQQYLTGKKFDLFRYLTDVHVLRSAKYVRGVDPIFGNLYLLENRERIISRIRDRREGKRKHGKLLTSLAWLTPEYSLWGRGESYSETVTAFTNELSSEKSNDSLYIFAYAEQDQDAEVINRLRIPQLKELHFSRPYAPDGMLMGGRLELLLYPTGFMAAVCHVSMSTNSGLWVPVGFMSTLPEHLDIAHKLIRKAMTGKRYGHKARLSQKDMRGPQMQFEEGCSFLNYSGLNHRSVDADEAE